MQGQIHYCVANFKGSISLVADNDTSEFLQASALEANMQLQIRDHNSSPEEKSDIDK